LRLLQEHGPKSNVADGDLRLAIGNALGGVGCFLPAFEPVQDHAQIGQCWHVPWRQMNGLLIGSCRFLEATKISECVAKIELDLGDRRTAVRGPFEQRDPFGETAKLAGRDASQVEHVDLLRVGPEQVIVDHFGIGDFAAAMQDQGRLES
jgi:hypothetical protein